jgi:hypothetical protein
MRPETQVLRIADAHGRVREVPMRWTASHQQGWTLTFDDPPGTFQARTLFEALADYRATIEPEGERLLHAAARVDCWPDPRMDGARIRVLSLGREDGPALDCFAPAALEEVVDLAAQRANFERWMASLAPVPAGRVRPREGHAHDRPAVDFSGLAIIAGAYLAGAEPDLQRVLARARRPDRPR